MPDTNLHYWVDGRKVYHTQEEIDTRAAKLAAKLAKRAATQQLKADKKAANLTIRASLKSKLSLTDEELDYIRGK